MLKNSLSLRSLREWSGYRVHGLKFLSTVNANLPKLSVFLRNSSQTGSFKSRRLRENGLIPGVVYGYDDDRNHLKITCVTEQKALENELRTKGKIFENTLYDLTVLDDPETKNVIANYRVLPRQTQINALTMKVMRVNFLKYRPGQKVTIPIEFVNAELSEASKRGCVFVTVAKSISVMCDGDIPKVLTVDLSNAQKGDVFRLNSIVFPQNCRPTKSVPSDLVLCSVKATK